MNGFLFGAVLGGVGVAYALNESFRQKADTVYAKLAEKYSEQNTQNNTVNEKTEGGKHEYAK